MGNKFIDSLETTDPDKMEKCARKFNELVLTKRHRFNKAQASSKKNIMEAKLTT